MSWLQSSVLIVLAGFCTGFYTQRQNSPSSQSVELLYHNSFPYKQTFLENRPNRDLLVSAIISRSAGPLCSGFHIQQNVVVTAASCVYREKPADLLVISNLDVEKVEGSLERLAYLSVQEIKIHKEYDPVKDLHNFAVLIVESPSIEVPVLRFPVLMSGEKTSKSNAQFSKFVYDLPKHDFYSVKIPASIQKDMTQCKVKNVPSNSFFCVSRSDSEPHSYGLRDLGTPLMYKAGNDYYLMGMFTGRNFDANQKYYPYQSAFANMEFLRSFTDEE